MATTKQAQATTYQRQAGLLTEREVPPAASGSGRGLRSLMGRRGGRAPDPAALGEAEEVVRALASCAAGLGESLAPLAELRRPRLLGKVEEEQRRVERIVAQLDEVRAAIGRGDLGEAGSRVAALSRELGIAGGGPLAVALSRELDQAAISREQRAALEANAAEYQAAVERRAASGGSPRSQLLGSLEPCRITASRLALTAGILANQAAAPSAPAGGAGRSRPSDSPIVQPQQLESLADVGGLEKPKEVLRRTVGTMLERAGESARAGALNNGILLHGPPGTGKTLLARAMAGEYGLRFLRFSPALIASAYQHEPATKLHQLFALAAESVPCLLFLDEIDVIAGRREGMTAPQRELVTQLLNNLEDYRVTPGLVIMAATNDLDHLDPALREGRFDTRIAVPLPDADERQRILEVQVRRHAPEAPVESLGLDEAAARTSGRSGAALASIVSGARQRALVDDRQLTGADLLEEIEGRSGQDRAQTIEELVRWEDVVLPEAVRSRLDEILLVFQNPELGRSLGVTPPAGILLHGPPGTGKTTIARALATEVKASFYEQSAADLMSKWVGESEQNVSQLFTRARANRPSIIFCDEIDAVLRRRSAGSSAPWEERVVSQFLRELDGLQSGQGVLLVGATNRVDVIDEAITARRLVPLEVPAPDVEARRRLLEVLCREVRLGPDVDLAELAELTPGMSGAGLKSLRNSAGMKALVRASRDSSTADASVTQEDFRRALADSQGAMAGE